MDTATMEALHDRAAQFRDFLMHVEDKAERRDPYHEAAAIRQARSDDRLPRPHAVAARLTPSAYEHGLALALPEKVVMARPAGFGYALTAYLIPIEGRDEWLAAARVRSA